MDNDVEVADDDAKARYSFGTRGHRWVNGGYGWMSYRYVTDGLANDWWTLISAN